MKFLDGKIRIVVQFCPCGHTARYIEPEITEMGGASQLERIAAGEKVDAPTFNSKHCPQCLDEAKEFFD